MGAVLIPTGFEGEPDGGAHIGGAADMDGLPVGFDDVFTDGQAETRPPFVPAAGRIGAIKPFEDAHKMFLFDADAVIADLDEYILLIYSVNAGYDAAIGLAVFRGVLHEVDQHHPDLLLVGENSDRGFTPLLDGRTDVLVMGFDR